MPIALENNTSNGIERSGFVHGMSCFAIYDSPDSERLSGDRIFPPGKAATEATKNLVQEREDKVDSCSSSSIGRNSDSSGGSSDADGDSGEGEAQSSYKGPFHTLDALEEVLPIKRGISTFYCGKSKSFTSLADAASCSSIKDIAKPENAYTRKRKNLLAHSNFWDKNCSHPSRSNSGGISKRPVVNSSRSTLALAVSVSSPVSSNIRESSTSNSSSPSLRLPPLPTHGRRSPNNESSPSPPRWNYSPRRSFSLSDLQHAVAAAIPSSTGLVIINGDKEDNFD